MTRSWSCPGATDITDLDDVRTSLMAVEPDAICHLAAQSSVGHSWQDPSGTFVVNVLGTLNVCTVATALKRSPRVLLVSSSEVYGTVGPEDQPINEDQPFAPVTPYAASKASAEMVGLQAWLGRRLDVVRAQALQPHWAGPAPRVRGARPGFPGRLGSTGRAGPHYVRATSR